MVTEEKPKNLMASTWTQASLVRRSFNAGPRRKSDLTFDDTEEAVLAAYTSFLDIRKDMRRAGLPVRDVRAALILMTAVHQAPFNGGVVTLLAIPDTIKGLPELLKETERRTKSGDMTPLGVAFWQRDKDPKAKADRTVWVQSWRVDPRVQRATDVALEAFAEADGRISEDGLNDTFEEL